MRELPEVIKFEVTTLKIMITLPEEFSKQISVFAPLFSKKVFEHAKVLITGAILASGRRTVCSALRSVGLAYDRRFHKFHRVLSLSKWSPYQAAHKLLVLLIHTFVRADEPLVFGIDETVERRWGHKIEARGIHRDAVRSSHSHFVKCSGLRWICLMLVVPIHWAKRIWALPFLTVLMPSKRYHNKRGIKHKKLTDWAGQMILQLKRWLPHRQIIVVADASYACYDLLESVRHQVCMITRLRLDARLFDFPPPRPKGKRGPNRIIGARQLPLQQRWTSADTQWTRLVIPQWYGHQPKVLLVACGKAIWYKSSYAAVPIQWVLIKDPENVLRPTALLCTDLQLLAPQIISFFICRWTLEVTFEEVRAHLGVESQRQWSNQAIQRTTPTLMALFSIVTLWANQLSLSYSIPVKTCAGYQKLHPTFSDAIAGVKIHIWRNQKFLTSYLKGDVNNLDPAWLNHLLLMACKAA